MAGIQAIPLCLVAVIVATIRLTVAFLRGNLELPTMHLESET